MKTIKAVDCCYPPEQRLLYKVKYVVRTTVDTYHKVRVEISPNQNVEMVVINHAASESDTLINMVIFKSIKLL